MIARAQRGLRAGVRDGAEGLYLSDKPIGGGGGESGPFRCRGTDDRGRARAAAAAAEEVVVLVVEVEESGR